MLAPIPPSAEAPESESATLPSDSNQPPKLESQFFFLEADAPAGTLVGTIRAHDPDQDQTLTFEVVGGSGATKLIVNPFTGEIAVQEEGGFDIATTPALTLLVQATDDGAPPLSAEATVTVHLLDEAAVDLTLSNDTILDTADNGGGAVDVGVFQVVGADSPGAYAFALEDGPGGEDNDSFQIDGDRLRFQPGVMLDHTEKESYSIRVRADDGAQPVSKPFTIRVIAGNERPIALDDQAKTSRGQAVAIPVLANDTDPDGFLVPISLRVTRDPEHGSLVLDADGAMIYIPGQDFAGQDVFHYTIDDNQGARSNEAVATIEVMDGPPWQNAANPADADQNGVVDLLDLLMVVEFLRRHDSRNVELLASPEEDEARVDVDGDGHVTMQDVVLIVNQLREQQLNAEPEGAREAVVAAPPRTPRGASPPPAPAAPQSFLFSMDDEEDQRWEELLNELAADVAQA